MLAWNGISVDKLKAKILVKDAEVLMLHFQNHSGTLQGVAWVNNSAYYNHNEIEHLDNKQDQKSLLKLFYVFNSFQV